jgi:hypothetical protein
MAGALFFASRKRSRTRSAQSDEHLDEFGGADGEEGVSDSPSTARTVEPWKQKTGAVAVEVEWKN